MPPARRSLLAVLALAVLALAAPAAAHAADCPGADITPAQQGSAAAGQSTLCLLNAERAAHNLAPLSENARLTQASQAYSELMVAQGFFAHETPQGVDLITRLTTAGYLVDDLQEWDAGENLAWGQRELGTPRSIVAAWMDSPGHRDNILGADYEEIGLGVAPGTPTAGSDGATYATDFGRRRTAPAATSTPAAAKPKKAKSKNAKAKKAKAKSKAKASSRKANRARAARAQRRQRAAEKRRGSVLRAQYISG
jgi:uncharacterized protein YkwD